MLPERMTKTDELFLTGDLIGFNKLLLKRIRSNRTQAKNLIAQYEMMFRKWPDSTTEEEREFYRQLTESIIRLDAAEIEVMGRLTDL